MTNTDKTGVLTDDRLAEWLDEVSYHFDRAGVALPVGLAHPSSMARRLRLRAASITPPAPLPVTIDDTSISARFNRLYGICRRILWADASTPAIGSEQTKAALADLAEFLFADGIDAALSGSEKE